MGNGVDNLQEGKKSHSLPSDHPAVFPASYGNVTGGPVSNQVVPLPQGQPQLSSDYSSLTSGLPSTISLDSILSDGSAVYPAEISRGLGIPTSNTSSIGSVVAVPTVFRSAPNVEGIEVK